MNCNASSVDSEMNTAPPAAKRATEDPSVADQGHPQEYQQKVASLEQKVASLEQEVAHIKKQLEQKKLELAKLHPQVVNNTMTSEHQPSPPQKLFVYQGQQHRCEIPPDITHLQVKDGTVRVLPRKFAGLEELTHVNLPNSLTSFSNGMFLRCKKLMSVEIPSSVKSIGSYCFYLSGISTINIPDNVQEIGEDAFERCSDLSEIAFPENNEMTTISPFVCNMCLSLKKVHIPSNIRRIETNAFFGARLEKLVLPDSVEYIGEGAFGKTHYLQTVHLPCNETISIQQDSFDHCPSLFAIPRPEKVSQSQFRSLVNIILENNRAVSSFRWIPIDEEDGQRAFDKTIPGKVWPILFSHRPKTELPGEMYIRRNFWMSQSTFDSLIFLHLKTNVETLLETSLCAPNTVRKKSL